MAKTRYAIIFEGRVQRVGFRFKAKRLADELKLTGYVKNLMNGDVEMEIQGEEDEIDLLIKRLNKDWIINIEKYHKNKIKIDEKEKGFVIL